MLVAMATHHATKQAAAIAVETATATIGMEPGPLTPVSTLLLWKPSTPPG